MAARFEVRRLRPAFWAAVFAALLFATSSEALLAPGAPRPEARVVDADDRAFQLGSVSGKPALVVYEDKESANLNVALKAELSKLAKGDRYRSAIALVPVADVAKYDYWPIRGFVKDSIRDESKKLGATIYCDWDKSFSRALGIQRGTSTVILIGRSGRVLFAYEGKVPENETRRLVELLRADVEGASGS